MSLKPSGYCVGIVDLRDGGYHAYWSGWTIQVVILPENKFYKTDRGMKGINVPCWVTVKDGKGSIIVK